jgi:energy-coupling factor transporter ATP-binding protein EcfA2
MSEAVVVRGRDWLAELDAAIEVGETEALGTLIGSIAASAPELRNAVCKAVGELGDGWEKWAEDFFAKPKPKPKLIRRLLKLPSVQQNAPVAVGPSKIGEAQDVLEKAQPVPKPEPEKAELKGGLPALIPTTKPLSNERVSRWNDALAAMNEQHAVIESVGGRTVIASWEPSSRDPNRLMIVYQTKESFLLRYSNRPVSIELEDGKGGFKLAIHPLGQWGLGHSDRLQFRGVMFRPGAAKVVSECLNLWQGWGVEPKAGDWKLIREHIEKVIADGNAEFAEYVIRWIAWSIQNPAAQAEVALVLIGHKGAGKGTLVRALQRIFGAHTFQVTSREEVIGKFNGHLQDCVLFVADEAYWGGDKRCVGRLQGMITEPWLPIERKGFDLIEVPNYLHVVMLAEPGWVIPAGRYERRYAAFSVSDAMRGEREYFKALHHQIANGGAEAMMWDLQRMDLDGWHPREIPESLLKGSALQEQQTHTLPPLEQWYLSLLRDGKVPGALVTGPTSKKMSGPSTAYTKSLRLDACDRFPRLRFELGDNTIAEFMSDKSWPKAQKFRDNKSNGWTFEPLAESRAAWDQRYGPRQWNEVREWVDREVWE